MTTEVALFYVLDLKLGISSKILIFMEILLWGRCLTPRFTPQNTWAAMDRHEALRVSNFNLATNCNLIRRTFVTACALMLFSIRCKIRLASAHSANKINELQEF